MTAVGIPANAKQLAVLVKEGEGPALEFKRSTGELKEGMRTLCAFLNDSGAEGPGSQGYLIATFKAQLVAEGAAEAPGVQSGQKRDQTTAQDTAQVGGQVTGQVAEQVLRFCQTPQKASEIRELLRLKHRETFTDNYLRPLLEKGWLEPTIPSKPRSRMQRHRTTESGLAMETAHAAGRPPVSATQEKSIRHGDQGTLHLLRTDPHTENNRRKE